MITHNASVTEDKGPAVGPQARGNAGPSHVLVASSPTDERTRVLKHGDTFAVFVHFGNVKSGDLAPLGP